MVFIRGFDSRGNIMNSNIFRLVCSSLLTIAMVLGTGSGASAEKEHRCALVLGNAAYQGEITPLENPVSDARAMKNALEKCSFDVIIVENGDKRGINESIRRFSAKIDRNSIALFYYSGHGIQYQGVNYIIPVNADIKSEWEIDSECIDMDRVLQAMKDRESAVNLVILDACRNNPFKKGFSRSLNKGLAKIDCPGGTLIAFATSPGETAEDGEGANSPYTTILLENLAKPDLEIMEMFREVRKGLKAKTNPAQVSWESTCLTEPFYFNAQEFKPPTVPLVKETPATQSTTQPIVASPEPASHQTGDSMTIEISPGVKMEFAWIQPGEFQMGKDWGEDDKAVIAKLKDLYSKYYDFMKDRKDNPWTDDTWRADARGEGPQHSVRITRGFWLGKCEVTQEEWETVMKEAPWKTTKEAKEYGDAGIGKRNPAYFVSWDDCQQFIAKLNEASNSETKGLKFRLPTEAEWEYACRAGKETTFYWGDEIDGIEKNCNYADDKCVFDWCIWRDRKRSDGCKLTASVGSFKPNAWGLYDMGGNVFEWCSDWYGGDYYSSAPVEDPDGPTTGSYRVSRGGSCCSPVGFCRSARRSWAVPAGRGNFLGLRLVLAE
jgi:formylglycine-generating enzyme required for sulfatase activity